MEFIENLSIVVTLATVVGLVWLRIQGRAERPIVQWYSGPMPRNLTAFQLDSVWFAKHHWACLRFELKQKNPSEKQILEEADGCFWGIVFSHFRSMDEYYGGRNRALSVQDVVERANRLKADVLIPRLIKIAEETDSRRKAFLACQYVFVLIAGVFDPTGGEINYNVIREVMSADYFSLELLGGNRGAFLKRIGFEPFLYEDDGTPCTTWYWPWKKSA